jgi:uncharacterized Fe-S cluster protein YjdI
MSRRAVCENADCGRSLVVVGKLVSVGREPWIDPVDWIGGVGAQRRVSRLCPVGRLCGIDPVRLLRKLGPLRRLSTIGSVALVAIEQRR